MKPEFLVIGAGLSRTGTLSLKKALEILLPGKCHHGLISYKHDAFWEKTLSGESTDEEVKNFFLSNDYVSGASAPIFLIYERLMKIFPNAKVVLTVREPEGWVKSISTLAGGSSIFSPLQIFLYLDLFRCYLADICDDETAQVGTRTMRKLAQKNDLVLNLIQALQQGKGVEFFNDYIKEVESKVPENKLLKFDVSEGWGPLCKHLNVPVPDVPFPKVNSSEEVRYYVGRSARRSWLLVYELITIPLLLYGVYKISQ